MQKDNKNRYDGDLELKNIIDNNIDIFKGEKVNESEFINED